MAMTDYHEKFASVYEAFYVDRDIDADAAYAARLLGLRAGDAVLDLGCGCGGHVLAFAALGMEGVGVDVSEAMIAQAQAKSPDAAGGSARFIACDFEQYVAEHPEQEYQGIVSIFHALNCLPTPQRLQAYLRAAQQVLTPGKRMLLDLWNGAAVMADNPRIEEHTFASITDPDVDIVRTTTPTVDRITQQVTLHYQIQLRNRYSGREEDRFESVHRIMFLTPVHYRHLFATAGFQVEDEFVRNHPGSPVSCTDWYMSYLLRKPT